jgi:hypothetical protein
MTTNGNANGDGWSGGMWTAVCERDCGALRFATHDTAAQAGMEHIRNTGHSVKMTKTLREEVEG